MWQVIPFMQCSFFPDHVELTIKTERKQRCWNNITYKFIKKYYTFYFIFSFFNKNLILIYNNLIGFSSVLSFTFYPVRSIIVEKMD